MKIFDSPLCQKDLQYVLHPYTSPTLASPALPVDFTEGCEIILTDGSRLIDGMASWWSVVHGYNHPQLVAAATEQIQRMPHVMFGGLTHQPAVSLAQTLVENTPAPLTKVFLADSGSIAVEVALKMAVQFAQASGKSSATKILTVRGGYYGDTPGAMSVCDPINGMHQCFQGQLIQQLFAPRPTLVDNGDDIAAIERIITENSHQLAAVIIEPILQGASGMWVYRAEYLSQLRALCTQHGVLLIADEIATGFGRTGRWLACEHAQITPDILCVGKALTGGMMSLAATLCSTQVAQGISNGEPGVIMHGPTFMANPLACATANASLSLLLQGQWQSQVAAIEQHFMQNLTPLKSHPAVADVRIIGAVGIVELKEPLNTKQVTPILLEQGVWLRPFGKLLYSMPPYIINNEQLSRVTKTMHILCNIQHN